MHFLKETLLHPKHTGAIAPSGERLVDLMIENAKLDTAETVVELGPGTGVFTLKILETISPDSTYFAIEINQSFVLDMKRTYPQAKVYVGGAEDIGKYLKLQGLTKCDRVISGLPWTAFEPELQENILKEIYNALSPDGLFLTFAYYPFNYLPNGWSFKKKLEERFSSVAETNVVPNLPPAFVYVCRK